MTNGGSTHDVTFDRARGVVVKKFRSAERGESAREWAALTLLARYAPGLAPAPVRADLDASPAMIEMTLLPGTQLRGPVVTPAQTRALVAALGRMWRSVPSVWQVYPVDTAPNAAILATRARRILAGERRDGDDPAVAHAYSAAADWLDSCPLDGTPAGLPAVLGQGDPNLANFLWDGSQIRVVDFEDSGPSDRAFELAILTEHISVWSEAGLDADDFIALFNLSSAEAARMRDARCLAALFWLLLLRPGSPSSTRNPPGTLQRQAARFLTLLS